MARESAEFFVEHSIHTKVIILGLWMAKSKSVSTGCTSSGAAIKIFQTFWYSQL